MVKPLLPIILLFSLVFVLQSGYSQTFEPVSFTQRSTGVASWGSDQMVVFGTGLFWIDNRGKTLDQQRIIDGLPSSDFIDAVSDGAGGLWLMTKTSVARLTKDKNSQLVISDSEFPKIQFSELFKTKSGEVYGLAKNYVFKLNKDNTFRKLYHAEKSSYFKNMAVSNDGTIYITDYKNVHVLNIGGEMNTTEFKTNYNFNDIFYTTDNKVIVLEYRGLYEFKNGELVDFLKDYQLTSGLKLYTGIFNSSTDYWLYSKDGNAFHNDNGNWINYTPPAGLKTGNLGEHMHKSDNGDIWMTLRGQTILHYDRQKWNKINLDKTQSILKIDKVKLIDGSTLVTSESETKKPYTFKNGELVPYSGLPARNLSKIQKVGEKVYYSDENALYSSVNSKETKLIDGKNINFVVFKDMILYQKNKVLHILRNGQHTELKDNIHFLGWEDLAQLSFALTADGKLLVFSSRQPRVVSVYDGDQWRKIIKSDQYGLGNLKGIAGKDSNVYLFNNSEDIYHYSEGTLSRIFKSDKNSSYSSAKMLPSMDSTVWFVSGTDLKVLKDGKVVSELSLPTAQKMGYIRTIVPVSDKVYNIYAANEIIRCTLP